MAQVSINADYIGEFASHSQWVTRAKRMLGNFGRHQQVVCVDKTGSICFIGEDFRIAQENDLFPVKAYRLKRTNEYGSS